MSTPENQPVTSNGLSAESPRIEALQQELQELRRELELVRVERDDYYHALADLGCPPPTRAEIEEARRTNISISDALRDWDEKDR